MLKNGACIQDRRLRTAEALCKCLAFDAVLWRACADLGRFVQYEQKRPEPMLSRPDFAEPPSAARPQAMESR